MAVNTYSDHVTILDDKALRLGDGFDFKALWNSGTSRVNITDSSDTLRWTFDPATGDLVQVTGASTINFEAMSITGVQDGDASMTFNADEGDDNADTWRIRAAAATNAFEIRNFATGSYVTAVGIASATNDVTLAGGLTVDGGTLSVTNGLITTAVTSLVLSSTAAGNAFISFDPKPDNGTSDARVRLFRLTNTTGDRQVDIFKGDGSATTTIAFNAATGAGMFTGPIDVSDITSPGDLTITPGGLDTIFIGRVSIGNPATAPQALFINSREDNETTGLRVARNDSTVQYIEIGTFNAGIINNVGGNKDFILRNSSTTVGDLLFQTQGANTRMTIGFDGAVTVEGALHLTETTAPTPIGSAGAWYTTSANQIFFQDGAGVSHLMGPSAFSGIAFTVVPADEVALTISNRDEWTKVTVFNSPDGHVNAQDAGGNVTGNKANSELTIGTDGGGAYRIMLSSSLSSVSASKMFFLGTAVDPASPITITSHTSATPSVITTASAHGLIVGDSIIITGSTDGTINRHSMVKTASGSTLTLDGFDGGPIGGTAGTGGTIDTIIHSSTIAHRVTNSTSTGSFNAPGDIDVLAGDVVYVVILNRDDSVNAEFETINLQIMRVGS